MEIGLTHLFYAFTLVWILLMSYLLNLAFRQKRLAEEIRALREQLEHKASD